MWEAVYKKLWIVILAPLLAGAVAYFIAGRGANQYRSVAIVEASIPDQPRGSKTLKDVQGPDEYYNSLTQAMKTEVITSMASYRLLLHDLEKEIAFRAQATQYSKEKKDLIRARLEKKLASFELLSEADPTENDIYKILTSTDYNLAGWIRNNQMTVDWKPGTNDIEVATSTEDPFLSAFASNALSQEYIRFETGVYSTEQPAVSTIANDSIALYRDEVARLRKTLEQKAAELGEAGKATPRSSVDDATIRRAKADRVAEFEMRILEEEWGLANVREQLVKLERPDPVASPTDVAATAKIQTIRKKIDQLSKIYVEGGSKDHKLDSIITKLRQQVNAAEVRLQASSPKTVKAPDPKFDRNRDVLRTRMRRHEETIASLRRDIWKVKNSTGAAPSTNGVAKLRREHEDATKAYNAALAVLKAAEGKLPQQSTSARASHHLILKEKALPSAAPESPWALVIVLSAVVVTLAIVLTFIALTKPAPQPYNDLFLRLGRENRKRMEEKRKHPQEGDVSPAGLS